MIFSSVGLDVLQSSLQEHIANDQLTVLDYVLERDGNHVRLTTRAGGQIPHTCSQQLHNIFVQRQKYLQKCFFISAYSL